MKLNLGCGKRQMEGWTGVDFYDPAASLKVDLFKFPWPWDDSSIDAVAIFHFLEHVTDLRRTVLEVHRILKPDGLFWLMVPHGFGLASFAIGHNYHFTRKTLHDLSMETVYRWPQPVMFRMESFKMRVGWTPLDWIAGRIPYLWEKFVPIRPIEMEWKGRAVKDVSAVELRSRRPHFVSPNALCESESVGEGTRIWSFSHITKGVTVGEDCNIGEHVFAETGASIGNRVTVKNGVMIWDGVIIEDDVFVGPGVLFANDRFPRSPRSEPVRERYSGKQWLEGVRVKKGASIGAGAVILPGVEIGEYAVVAAGSVVTTSVAPYRLVVGSPARNAGFACVCGRILPKSFSDSACEACGRAYTVVDGALRPAR